ncbi:mitochondrial 37S ribosomal protein rsm10 [Coemansia sp. Benny D115]|nr:mitochondrial 37S ribosomal protein rsm10 [Coemansia sp. Benny D115]
MFRTATASSSALLRRAMSGARPNVKAVVARTAAPATFARSAATYAKILDKVLGIDVRNKTKMASPKDVDSLFEKPEILPAEQGIQVCRVAFRSFQLQRMDFYLDFCRKAAFHMGIPCTGTICLPRVVRRWTVLKSPFVHKSAMEVFERRTHKRLLVVRDADPQVVKKWLEYINKNMPAGLGMKYWMTEYETLDVGQQIDEAIKTNNSRIVDAQALANVKRAQKLVQSGRRRMWTTYKDLPTYDSNEVKNMALDIAAKLKLDPKANIEAVTRQVVMATRPPKPEKPAKKARAEPAKPEAAKPQATNAPAKPPTTPSS